MFSVVVFSAHEKPCQKKTSGFSCHSAAKNFYGGKMAAKIFADFCEPDTTIMLVRGCCQGGHLLCAGGAEDFDEGLADDDGADAGF